MAKKRRGRGRYVEVMEMHVESKGKNLQLMFRIPAESIREVFPLIKRFVKRTKNVKRAKEGSTYTKS